MLIKHSNQKGNLCTGVSGKPMLAKSRTKSCQNSASNFSNFLNDSKGKVKRLGSPGEKSSKFAFNNPSNNLSRENTGDLNPLQDPGLDPKTNAPIMQQNSSSKNSQLAIIEKNLTNLNTTHGQNCFLTLNINVSNFNQQNQQNSASTNILEQQNPEFDTTNNKDAISLNELGFDQT